jgi:hypothetical protein
MLPPVQGLWIGPSLSALERLSIASFLHHGHPFHLYTYGEVAGVPAGTVVRDGGEILPAARIFQYRHFHSYSAFSNFFRYKLLLERGGWWVDTDVVCLRPFAFGGPYVFATEPCGDGETPATAVIRVPAGSAIMSQAWKVCQAKDRAALSWGEVGPRLLKELIETFGLGAHTEPSATFCPIAWDRWEEILDPGLAWEPGERTYGLHLWHEMWRRGGRDKDGTYPSGCLHEGLKRRFLGS